MTDTATNSPPTYAALLRIFAKIGVISFGGPAAQISLMHRLLVEEKHWLTETQFMRAISFCMLLPGPEAMQIATYAGWKLRGILGGLIAGLLFILPGAFVILALAMLYAEFGAVPEVQSMFLGIKAAVLMIVIDALRKVARRALNSRVQYAIAGFAFMGLFVFALPYPLILIIAALIGFFGLKREQEQTSLPLPKHMAARSVTTAAIWLCVWAAPVILIGLFTGQSLFIELATFFSKLAVVTFGGAYAVLAYMSQDVVAGFGWLTAGEMIDGLGLAETTPGPLILVTEFVGFLAGFKEGGLWVGILSAAITLWVTFVPCFLWIFVGAPYIDWISSQGRISNALSGITSAVVGVMLNLSLWFALHTVFSEVNQLSFGVATFWLPEFVSFNGQVVILAGLSAIALFWLRWGVLPVLALSSGLGYIVATI